MKYRVTRQYPGRSASIIATMDDVNDAKKFMTMKADEDASLKVNTIYRVEFFDEIIEEIDSSKHTPAASTQSTGSQRSSGASYNPTPFNTTPTPPGLPKKWIRDEDDDDKK